MDAATIIESLDALAVADLRKVAHAAADLLGFYEQMAAPAPNVVEQRVGSGGCYRLEMVRCGKEACKKCEGGAYGHGPYWYVYTSSNGRKHKRYIGKNLPNEARL